MIIELLTLKALNYRNRISNPAFAIWLKFNICFFGGFSHHSEEEREGVTNATISVRNLNPKYQIAVVSKFFKGAFNCASMILWWSYAIHMIVVVYLFWNTLLKLLGPFQLINNVLWQWEIASIRKILVNVCRYLLEFQLLYFETATFFSDTIFPSFFRVHGLNVPPGTLEWKDGGEDCFNVSIVAECN